MKAVQGGKPSFEGFICLSTGERITCRNANGRITAGWPALPPKTLLKHIGVSLSRMPRFAGHTLIPYNVCAHSIVCMKLAEAGTDDSLTLLHVLLHDAHESVTGDIPSPVKHLIGADAVKRVEAALDAALWKSLGIAPPTQKQKAIIREIDGIALHAERRELGAGWNVAAAADLLTPEARRLTAELAEMASIGMSSAHPLAFVGIAMNLLKAATAGHGKDGE